MRMRALSSRKCRCGALRERSKSRCQKCQDRAQWYRRKAWKTPNHQNRRGGNLS
jgi:hypothetical protein